MHAAQKTDHPAEGKSLVIDGAWIFGRGQMPLPKRCRFLADAPSEALRHAGGYAAEAFRELPRRIPDCDDSCLR